MTATNMLANFAARYGISKTDARDLKRMVDLYAKQQERVCNGDPHISVADRTDKNANAEAWDKQSEQTAELLKSHALRIGFDGVDFGVGLYPCLIKGNETCIMVP